MKTMIWTGSSALLSGEAEHILLLPEAGARRLLTLLHGAGEGPDTLLARASLAEEIEARRLAVLLPALGNSFCADWGSGQNARSFLLEVLLPWARQEAGLSAAPEENAVGGISMGGYGALRLALGEPGRFSRAFSLSGALDLKKAAQLCRICQLPMPGSLSRLPDPLSLLMRAEKDRPALYLAWGEQDWFRAANGVFSAEARSRGFSVQAAESPGLHDWAYWAEALPPALRWAAEK